MIGRLLQSQLRPMPAQIGDRRHDHQPIDARSFESEHVGDRGIHLDRSRVNHHFVAALCRAGDDAALNGIEHQRVAVVVDQTDQEEARSFASRTASALAEAGLKVHLRPVSITTS
jgi:hypothetical protein